MTDRSSENTIQKLAKETADVVVEQSDNVLWRVARRLPFLNQVVANRERSLAREQCAQMLGIYKTLRAGNAKLEGEALYERAVAERLSCDQAKAKDIVRLADLSFAQWPEERDVSYRDIVNYLIVNQILGAHTKAIGTLADIDRVVRASIPAGL